MGGKKKKDNAIFTFKFGESSELQIPIYLPYEPGTSFRELAFQLIDQYKIPLEFEPQFFEELQHFITHAVEEYEDSFYDEEKGEKIERFSRFSSLLKAIYAQNRLSEENCSKSKLETPFWQKYHTLVHSGFLTEPLVTLEHSFSAEIQNSLELKSQASEELRNHQVRELASMLERPGSCTDEDVNKLSVTHFAELDDMKRQWDVKLHEIKVQQKREFTEWIDTVYQDIEREGECESIVRKIRSRTETSLASTIERDLDTLEKLSDEDLSAIGIMDESFTINLGTQLKTTHNLRLVCSDILATCKSKFSPSLSLPTPQRIHTAMSLYSSSLSGLVLLADADFSINSPSRARFIKLCQQSTDFHFPSWDEQMDQIKCQVESKCHNKLHPGDFYTTKHSNLSEVHVVFHLVTDDDSFRNSEISSRHPVVLGLRNILKTAYLSDITTISLPLLLAHEMSEHMTLQWCLKRAELVFKCVKGFMIEMTSLAPSSEGNRTLRFVLPEGIQEQLFTSLASMLPSIFRLSNPLVLSSQ